MSDLSQMDFDTWMEIGIMRGFVGAPICYTHDGLPMSADEDEAFDQGDDPCMHILRLYMDAEHKEEIEENHSPSVWRNPYSKNA
jgi:hypothetical protein